MISIYRKTLKDKTNRVVKSAVKGSHVYCIDPTQEEIEKIALNYSLDKGLLNDALDPYEVPRLEQEEKTAYAISSFPQKEGERFVGIPFAVIMNLKNVFVISRKPVIFLENFFSDEKNFITTQMSKLVILIFRRLMESYHVLLTDINREVHKISITPTKIASSDIARLVLIEESLNLFIGDLIPTDSILKTIQSDSKIKLFEKDRDLVEDTVLYTEQLIDITKSNLKTISNLRNAYSAIVAANLNNTMKFLTAATVILTVPTIIASIFGMNVSLPFSTHPLAFVFIILIIIGSSLLLVYLFIKKDWF